jgi:hypothetical protein
MQSKFRFRISRQDLEIEALGPYAVTVAAVVLLAFAVIRLGPW